jgi:hypothetical protein
LLFPITGKATFAPKRAYINITAKEARDILGFKSFVVATFSLANNMSALEEKMQRILFDDHGYNKVGQGQLFRFPGAGPDQSGKVGVCQVFITYSFDLQSFFQNEYIEYNP